MKTKEYRLFKTAAKTARENNLVIIDTGDSMKTLFDLSLLNDVLISESEKQLIIDDCKHISAAFRTSFYGKAFDQFECCDGIADYTYTNVYSEESGKLFYRIYRLCKLRHASFTRESVYNEYHKTTWEVADGYDACKKEVEI